MAFKTIQTALQPAVKLGSSKGSVKQVSGYLAGFERPKKAKSKKSKIYHLRQDDGGEITVWGCAAIDNALLTPDDGKIRPEMAGVLVRFTFQGARKIRGRSQPMKEILVEYDAEKTLAPKRGGKDYALKN